MTNALVEKIRKGFEWFYSLPEGLYEQEWPDLEEIRWNEMVRPIREGVRNNDIEVVMYLEQLPPKYQLEIYPAIEYGLEDQQKKRFISESSQKVYDRAMRLYRRICKENNHRIMI